MKRSAIFAAAISILTLLFAAGSFAQRNPCLRELGSGGFGMNTPYQRLYDPSKVVTLTGTVESVETVRPMKGMYNAVVLILKTTKETIPVHLGPQWYIERIELGIKKGDTLVVRGSRVELNNKPIIIAAEIMKGNQSVTLRNDKGIPVWAGWR